MTKAKLDHIDLQILTDLQNNGRVTNVELAKNSGISAPPCLRRLRALEDNGYIEGYHAQLSAQKLEFGIIVFVMISLSQHKGSDLDTFANEIRSFPRVRECHALAGSDDFLLKVIAKDWDDYQNFLTEKLTAMPLIRQVNSHISVKAMKSEAGLPLELIHDEFNALQAQQAA